MKAALVHDWLNQLGGAEDVLQKLVALYPAAPVFTALYAANRMPAAWRAWDIRPGFIDRLPFARRVQQLYLPLYPACFESFDFRAFDLVISNKSGFCHGVITGVDTVHICYCLTPTRYVWRYEQYAEQESLSPLMRTLLRPMVHRLRLWDRLAADRVDHFVAISEAVRRRIAKFYRREATIIHPPVDTGRFKPVAADEVADYYLFVGRLVPYRRLDLLVEAFNRLEKPLLIAGSGRDRPRLESLAGQTISFLGYVADDDLPALMARARAFVWPGEEDFGIAPIQAMAAGRPVIAYAAGGALDTVAPGTGTLFAEQTVEAMIEAVMEFQSRPVDVGLIQSHAATFDTQVFMEKMAGFVAEKLGTHWQDRATDTQPWN